jgi:hypothetical protein
MSEPVISVVVVSDYGGGTPGSLDDYRHSLRALAAQDFDEPVEYLLSEWEGFRDRVAADLETIVPSVRIVFSEERSAFGLKNEGVRHARAPLVALLDADCDPAPGWLRASVDALRAHPEVAAVSGRTLSRALDGPARFASLADRVVGDEGSAGPTVHVSLNNIAFRRDFYLDHPLSSAAGSCGFAFHSQALLRQGHRLWFDPGMEVAHDPMDFAAVRDARRLMGFSVIVSRKLDPQHPHAWLVRLGYASIPIFVVTKTLLAAKRIIVRGPAHGLRWYHVPGSVAAAFVRHVLEVPGMITAFRGRAVRTTQFR